MATAKKLPSGNYRVRGYNKYLKKYKSFTHPNKKIAERMANEYALLETNLEEDITVNEAANIYISDKTDVLSPTTISAYKGIVKNNLTRLLNVKLNDLTPRIIQDWVNEMTIAKSPKTVRNIYGFLTAVLSYNDVTIKLSKIRLPAKTKTFKRLPPPKLVINTFKDTDIEIPVLLGLWCGMRMSEILGIRKSDIDGDILTINQVIVTVNNQTVIKRRAKTFESNRQVRLPKPILDLINNVDCSSNDLIIHYTRKQVYDRFVNKIRALGYPITFHDLRHINASVMAALNVPDIYAMERGGWSSTNTLKGVYQQTFDENRQKVDNLIDDYFLNIYDTKYDTNKINNRKNVG